MFCCASIQRHTVLGQSVEKTQHWGPPYAQIRVTFWGAGLGGIAWARVKAIVYVVAASKVALIMMVMVDTALAFCDEWQKLYHLVARLGSR